MKTKLLARIATLLGLAASAQAATFTVTTMEDEFDSPSGPSVSLQEALRDAAASPGSDLITFAPSLSGATLSPRGELFINDASDVEVSAMALERGLILSGGNTHRILSVSGLGRLTLRGLTLTAGAPNVGNGGAIFNTGELFLIQCAVHGNTALNGGAIFNNGGTLNLSLTTLAGNSARTTGGAIFNAFGKLTLNHVTATGNSAVGQGGGLFSFGSLATLALENSIVAGNTGNGGADLYVESGFTVLGANLVQGSAGAPFTGGGSIIASNPLLSPLASRGGPTPTCSLQLGSPAREAAVGSTLGHDQRGYPVVGSPDIGAYETQIGPVSTIFIGQNTPSGPIHLNVGIVGKLTVTSGNPILIPDLNILLNESGGSYTIILTPSGLGPGLVIITLIDNDSGDIVTFMVQINNEPTVGALPDTTVMENTSTETIAFTVDDLNKQ